MPRSGPDKNRLYSPCEGAETVGNKAKGSWQIFFREGGRDGGGQEVRPRRDERAQQGLGEPGSYSPLARIVRVGRSIRLDRRRQGTRQGSDRRFEQTPPYLLHSVR